MKFLVIGLGLFTALVYSCGKNSSSNLNTQNDKVRVNPYFQSFIRDFKREAQRGGLGIGDFNDIRVIDFKDDSTKKLGECDYIKNQRIDSDSNDFGKEIYFSNKIKDLNYEQQYATFLHEMGHCAYHLPEDSSDPREIMYPDYATVDPNVFDVAKHIFFLAAKKNQDHWFDTTSPLN